MTYILDLGKTEQILTDRFERMMNDVRAGKINCILAKDFSRFGRNYIETGNYLEKDSSLYESTVYFCM